MLNFEFAGFVRSAVVVEYYEEASFVSQNAIHAGQRCVNAEAAEATKLDIAPIAEFF